MDSTLIMNQLHIGIFGKRSSGKSTLINALTDHHTARVFPAVKTTTDPVYQAIKIEGIGPCVLIDTAGFDDGSYQELMRSEKMRQAMERTDIALIVCSEENIALELEWAREFKARRVPVIMVINKIDQISNTDKIRSRIYDALKEEPIKISAISKLGIEKVREEIIRSIPKVYEVREITEGLVTEGDLVLLVTPPQIQASKGRLLHLQMQVIRELLDKKCVTVCCSIDKLEQSLGTLVKQPKLMISDPQVLETVKRMKPAETELITYSI